MKKVQEKTDEELVSSILNQNNEALGELYQRYYKKVYHKCLSIMKDHDEAFDLAQESIIQAFNNLKHFRGDSAFATWLYVITHRHCLGELRKRNRLVKEKFPTVDMEFLETENTDNDDRNLIMVTLINALPENEKKILLLKYSEGESIYSLQNILHLSPSAIKMRLMRSRERLNTLYNIALSSGLTVALARL